MLHVLHYPGNWHSVKYLTKEINTQQRVKQNDDSVSVHWDEAGGDEVSKPCSGLLGL